MSDENYDRDLEIIKFIIDNPNCRNGDILKELVEKRKIMSASSFNRRLTRLVNLKYVLKSKDKTYSTQLNNAESGSIEFFPHIKDLDERIKLVTHELKNTRNKLLETGRPRLEQIINESIERYISIRISPQIIGNEELVFSNDTFGNAKKLVNSMLVMLFLNNPDAWHILKKKEDLNLNIEIKINWHETDDFITFISLFRESFIEKGNIYEFETFINRKADKESQKAISGKSLEDLYNKAFKEHKKRNKSNQ